MQLVADPHSPEAARAAASQSRAAAAGKFLSFWLAGEEFAVPVQKIKEIIGLQEITPVPQTAVFVKGVINLRGRVVPVIDLRLKLGMPSAEYHDRTCVIVMQPEAQQGSYSIGVVVEGVSEVLQIQKEEIEETSSFSHGLIQAAYIRGVAKVKGGVKILLDIDCVLSTSEHSHLNDLLN